MAFCNACGANIAAGARFCNKCGAAIVASSPAGTVASAVGAPPLGTLPAPVPSAPPGSGSNALKVALIVVGVLVLVGILGMVTVGLFAWRVARHTHVHQNGNDVKVETPFGNVETTTDPQEAARAAGVELYPGAQAIKQGTSSATFGGLHTATFNSETSDSADKVCSFYKSKFPNAMVTSTDANQCTFVSSGAKNMITINVKAEDDKTHIMISNVSKAASNSSSSSQ